MLICIETHRACDFLWGGGGGGSGPPIPPLDPHMKLVNTLDSHYTKCNTVFCVNQ